MNQDIIVYSILVLTIGYALYSIVKKLKVKKNQNKCGGCNGCAISKNIPCGNEFSSPPTSDIIH